LAITKKHKEEILAIYQDWFKRSHAVILVEYTGARMKDMDNIRAKIRESGGEFHVVKNTLARRVFADQGMNLPDGYLENRRRSRSLSSTLRQPPKRSPMPRKAWNSSKSRAVL